MTNEIISRVKITKNNLCCLCYSGVPYISAVISSDSCKQYYTMFVNISNNADWNVMGFV